MEDDCCTTEGSRRAQTYRIYMFESLFRRSSADGAGTPLDYLNYLLTTYFFTCYLSSIARKYLCRVGWIFWEGTRRGRSTRCGIFPIAAVDGIKAWSGLSPRPVLFCFLHADLRLNYFLVCFACGRYICHGWPHVRGAVSFLSLFWCWECSHLRLALHGGDETAASPYPHYLPT